MWIKRALILFPLTLILMIIVASFFVPATETIAQNEGRQNRIVWTLSSDVNTLNPWFSTSTTDSTVYDHIFEGLLASNGDYELEPHLAKSIRIGEEFVVALDAGADVEAHSAQLDAAFAERYPKIYAGLKPYDWRDFDSRDKGYFINRKYPAGQLPPEVEQFKPTVEESAEIGYGTDGVARLVFTFRPDPEVEYGPKDMPAAIAADAPKILDEVLKDSVKQYEPFNLALGWYARIHGADAASAIDGLTLPAKIALPDDYDPATPPAATSDEDEDGDGEEDASDESADPASGSEVESSGGSDDPEDMAAAPKLPESEALEAALEALSKAQEAASGDWSSDQFATIKQRYESARAAFATLVERLINAPASAAGDADAWKSLQAHAKTLSAVYGIMRTQAEKIATAALKESEKTVADGAAKTSANNLAFPAFLKGMPAKRFTENPLVMVTLQEGVKWHDYGRVEPVFDDWGRPVKLPNGEVKTETIKEILDAEDVAFTFQFGRNPEHASPRKTAAEKIQQFRIHDSHTFDVSYGELYSPALSDLGYSILPRHRLSMNRWFAEARAKGVGPISDGKPEASYNVKDAVTAKGLDFGLDPVGTGPLRLTWLNGDALPRWRSGELIRLETFDEYWDPLHKPHYQFMDFYVFDPDLGQETADLTFRSGGTDVYSVRQEQVEEFTRGADNWYLFKRLQLSYEYIAFNLGRKPFDNHKVRQALTMAVNVEEIIKYIVYEQGRRINGPAYPLLGYYNPDYVPDYTFLQGEHAGKNLRDLFQEAIDAGDEELARTYQYFPFDMDEARALLESEGYKKRDGALYTPEGKPMEFKIALGGNASSSRGKIATLAQEKWRELGIKVDLVELEWNVFINEYALQRNFDCLVLGWANGTSYDNRQLWHSEFLSPGAGLNFVEFKDKKVDALFDEILKAYETDEQIRISHEIFSRIASQNPYIFLFSPYANVAVNRDLYWAKPIIKNGKVTGHEERSVLDPITMNVKKGPTAWEFRSQWRRAPERKFQNSESELRVVNSLRARQALAEAQAKNQ